MSQMRACPVCGGELEPASVEREVKVGKRSATVLDEFFRCGQCGEELYAPGQMDASLRRASEKIRREEGLLLPGEIRRIRENLGLTQSDLEELLGLGTKTVVRWEKGTVFQNSATDSLLRALRDVAGVAEYFAQRKGVEIRRASKSA